MTDEGVVLALNRIAEAIERQPLVIHIPRFLTNEQAAEIKARVQSVVGPNRPIIVIGNQGPRQEQWPEPETQPVSTNGFA